MLFLHAFFFFNAFSTHFYMQMSVITSSISLHDLFIFGSYIVEVFFFLPFQIQRLGGVGWFTQHWCFCWQPLCKAVENCGRSMRTNITHMWNCFCHSATVLPLIFKSYFRYIKTSSEHTSIWIKCRYRARCSIWVLLKNDKSSLRRFFFFDRNVSFLFDLSLLTFTDG